MYIKVQNSLHTFFVKNELLSDLSVGDNVIVSTTKGMEYVTVKYVYEINADKLEIEDEMRVLRYPTKEDDLKHTGQIAKQPQLRSYFEEEVQSLKLNMRFIDVIFAHDNSYVMYFYKANERVDFRELVKRLGFLTRTRVELRQLSDREKAKMVGGIGPCGYTLCCSTFLKQFDTVNVKMAKTQLLSFNLQRVTGLCERLLCCLKYEQEQYLEMKKGLPDMNRKIELSDGRKGKVRGLQLLSEEITIQFIDESIEKMDFKTFLNIYIPYQKEVR